MFKQFIFIAVLFILPSFLSAEKKVLYFTHEPGRWHKYTPQISEFKDIGKEAGWNVTISTGEHKEQLNKLKVKDYAKGFDAVVYNFCFASDHDLDACSNLMKQTKENGVPAMLVHCSLHSFWPTYKQGKKKGVLGESYKGKAKPKADLVKKWKESHPNEEFPAWGDFTGVASFRHGPHLPLTTSKIKADHPALKDMPETYTTTGKTELYNNVYVTDDVVPILKGKQTLKDGKVDEAIVMWEVPRGKSKVIGLTLGHSVTDWKDKEFRGLVINGLNYLMMK
ncbi:MAG: ThuA domain-containing protein [Lentisphaeraceae bacterium]|nr:ThuA domain-containing protein [Lentisphaeraceae bacterium]